MTADFKTYCNENNIQIVAYQPIKRQAVLENEMIQKIANAHKATPAQVSLAWLLTKNALPIPKAIHKKHIDENVSVINIRLSDTDMIALDNVS